jgi:hypothetical protein
MRGMETHAEKKEKSGKNGLLPEVGSARFF